MPNNTYKKIEIVGTSPGSLSEAVQDAITRAGQTVNHLQWFEVTEIRGSIEDNRVGEYQVSVKIGFKLE